VSPKAVRPESERVRVLNVWRYLLASAIKILMPGAKKKRQALRSLTRRCAAISLLWG
jgi:hypothetical protein